MNGRLQCKRGQNYYGVQFVGSNVTEMIEEEAARRKRAPAGLLATVDFAVARTLSFGGVDDVILDMSGEFFVLFFPRTYHHMTYSTWLPKSACALQK